MFKPNFFYWIIKCWIAIRFLHAQKGWGNFRGKGSFRALAEEVEGRIKAPHKHSCLEQIYIRPAPNNILQFAIHPLPPIGHLPLNCGDSFLGLVKRSAGRRRLFTCSSSLQWPTNFSCCLSHSAKAAKILYEISLNCELLISWLKSYL